MKFENLYPRLPVFAQNIACSLYGWRARRIRMGRGFERRLQDLLESEAACRDEIEEYQNRQVARLVEHAYRSVPYYRESMEQRGLQPGDVTSREELPRLPVLTKEEVVREQDRLRSREWPRRSLLQRRTSGTTGTALTFLTTRDAVAFQWAVWWRHRARFGFRPGTWHLNFTGKPVVPMDQTAPPFWRWNVPLRQALVSQQQLRPDRAMAFASFIEKHRFPAFTGYPSLLHSFATLLEEAGVTLRHRPDIIALGAENVQSFQRISIERVLCERVTDQYGFAEGSGNASQCEKGRYHEDWEFGVLECVDPERMPDGSIRGRIVATGFANEGFPFIRYQVGDSATWEPPDFRCECGRESAVLRRIEGRMEDYIVTPEGHRVMRFDYLFKDTHGIKEAQVIQEVRGEIVIRFVARPQLSSSDESRIRRKVEEWISPGLRVRFEEVDEIPRGENGKFRPVVSELAD